MNANNKTGVRSVLNRSKYSFLLCCVLFTTGLQAHLKVFHVGAVLIVFVGCPKSQIVSQQLHDKGGIFVGFFGQGVCQ